MSKILKAATAAAVLAFGATIAVAQTTEPKSKTEAGAPQQGPTPAAPAPGSAATGAAPGTPSTVTPGTPPNPTGQSQEKQKSDSNDPQQGGKKQ